MLFFYQPEVPNGLFQLEGDEFQHCVRVLRKKVGDQIGIVDGKGALYTAEINEISKRELTFNVIEKQTLAPKSFYNHIAIAPTKNMDRIEFFVEKACELGVDEISFILTKNCERRKLKTDRLIKKAISALKQSKSGYLTQIKELQPFENWLKSQKQSGLIAMVDDGLPNVNDQLNPEYPATILIGPEGDFTQEEVALAVNAGFEKVSLGKSTLRTETAGIIAAHAVNVANRY